MTNFPHQDDPRANCRGCKNWQPFQGEIICLNLISWHPDTPENPECYEATLRLVDCLTEHEGADHD